VSLWIWLVACSPPGIDSGPSQETETVIDTGDTGSTTDTEPLPLELCINEFMPDNQAALFDDLGATPDWIELHNPGTEEVVLSGWSLTDDPDDPDDHVLPAGLTLPPGAFLVFYADGEPEAGPLHVAFRLSAEGGTVGLFAPDGRGSLVHHGRVESDFSVARTDDCCTGEHCLGFDFRGTPGAANNPPVPVEVTLLPLGSTWRYHSEETAPGSGWMAVVYDDSAWPSGPAPLGYGDTHQVTVIDGGPEGDRRPAAYFRSTFEVADLDALQAAALRLTVDDAALVWLNGQEAARQNLPEGDIAHETWALEAVGGADETTPRLLELDLDLLQEGTNVLAVEVHQAAPTSSDLTFDLGVTGEVLE